MFLLQPWIIFAALAGLASNGFNYFTRFVLKDKDDPIAFAWYYETLRFFVFAALAFFDFKLDVNPKAIFFLLGIGITEWISMYFYMKMHSYVHLSISAIISRTRLIWVAILAFFIVGETLKTSEYIGIIILFLGLCIVVAPKKLVSDKGAVYANLAAFLIALDVIFIRLSLPYASNSVINAAMSLPGMILFPIFMKNPAKMISIGLKKNLKIKTLAILINCVSVFLFAIAIRLADTGKVQAVYQGMMVFSVLAGIIFLKERENIGRKLIGTAVTLVGILLLTSM
jgi:drug/metabolite transporter (DMT)-like permease